MWLNSKGNLLHSIYNFFKKQNKTKYNSLIIQRVFIELTLNKNKTLKKNKNEKYFLYSSSGY